MSRHPGGNSVFYVNNLVYQYVTNSSPNNSNSAFQLDDEPDGGQSSSPGPDTASNNISYCTQSGSNPCNAAYNGATYSCTTNKCATEPSWVSVGGIGGGSAGTATTPPSATNFALGSESPAIGYGLTEPYLPSSSVDVGACSSQFATCP